MNEDSNYQYKFRAECIQDFVALLNVENNCILCYKIESFELPITPDVTVCVNLKEGFNEFNLLHDMSLIMDSHIMRRTLAPVECYTGDSLQCYYQTL